MVMYANEVETKKKKIKKLTTTCMYHLKKGIKWIAILKEESILHPVYVVYIIMNTKISTLRV